MSSMHAISGASLAAAAALILAAGAATYGNSAQAAEVQCSGINVCKGTIACKTASNACKGQGWVPIPWPKSAPARAARCCKRQLFKAAGAAIGARLASRQSLFHEQAERVRFVGAERAALGVAEFAIERDRFRLLDAGLELHQRNA